MRDFDDLTVNDEIGPLEKTPTNVTLFMYSAAVWLVHRIHYDYRFSTEHEGLSDVVLGGTLAADWFAQMLHEWGGRGVRISRLTYENRSFMLPGQKLICGGVVSRKYSESGENFVDCKLWIKGPGGHEAVRGFGTVVIAAAKTLS